MYSDYIACILQFFSAPCRCSSLVRRTTTSFVVTCSQVTTPHSTSSHASCFVLPLPCLHLESQLQLLLLLLLSSNAASDDSTCSPASQLAWSWRPLPLTLPLISTNIAIHPSSLPGSTFLLIAATTNPRILNSGPPAWHHPDRCCPDLPFHAASFAIEH